LLPGTDSVHESVEEPDIENDSLLRGRIVVDPDSDDNGPIDRLVRLQVADYYEYVSGLPGLETSEPNGRMAVSYKRAER
jgi:hypothetical protein